MRKAAVIVGRLRPVRGVASEHSTGTELHPGKYKGSSRSSSGLLPRSQYWRLGSIPEIVGTRSSGTPDAIGRATRRPLLPWPAVRQSTERWFSSFLTRHADQSRKPQGLA